MADVEFELRPDASSRDQGTGFLTGSIARTHLPGTVAIGPLANDEGDGDDDDQTTGLNLCDPQPTDLCPADPP